MVTELKRAELVAATHRNFETVRLPCALALKEEVDAGGMLSESDKQFLEEMLRDIERTSLLFASEPTLMVLHRCAARLYDEIVSRDGQNARGAKVEEGGRRAVTVVDTAR